MDARLTPVPRLLADCDACVVFCVICVFCVATRKRLIYWELITDDHRSPKLNSRHTQDLA